MATGSPTNRQVTITMQGTTRTLECLEPWLDDGNIVLVVQEKCFRAHRTILSSYSEVFRNMFAIPHTDGIEEDTIDGCPVVPLQDPVDQVQIMLRAFYDRSFVFFHNSPMPVAVLEAFFLMGKKYAVPQLLKEVEIRLLFDSPLLSYASGMSAAGNMTLSPRVSSNDPFNFTIMNIAGDGELLSTTVMSILYCCLACPPESIADGYEFEGKRFTLSSFNTRCCILAQRFLADVERHMVQALGCLGPRNCERRARYISDATCSSAILGIIRHFQDLKCPFSMWDPVWDQKLCNVCREQLQERYEDVRVKLWDHLPTAMGLGPWEKAGSEEREGLPGS